MPVTQARSDRARQFPRRLSTVRTPAVLVVIAAPTLQSMLYPALNAHFIVQRGSGLTFKTFKLLNTVNDGDSGERDPDGFGSGFGSKAFKSGIILSGTNAVNVSNVAIDAVFGDGIKVGGEPPLTCTSDVSMRSVSVDQNGRRRMAVACAVGVVIDRVKVLHSHVTAIDLEPNGTGSHAKNIEISNSYLDSKTVTISSAGTYDISDVSVHDNILGGWDPSYPWLCVCGPISSHCHDWRVWYGA